MCYISFINPVFVYKTVLTFHFPVIYFMEINYTELENLYLYCFLFKIFTIKNNSKV